MQIWNEEFESNYDILIDPNNIFQYFNSTNCWMGYGNFFGGNSKINFSQKKEEKELNNLRIASIISSIILYPEVLSNGDEKNYFLEVRKVLREKIKNNENVKILDILKSTKGFIQVFEKIKNNFNKPEEFEEYFYKIDESLKIKKDIFKNILLGLDMDEKTNQLKEIKNPHLTGDASEIAELIDFDRYFSIEELKKKPENEQVRIMNKILKGKFFDKNFNEEEDEEKFNEKYLYEEEDGKEFNEEKIDLDVERRIISIINYLYNSNNEMNRSYILNIIKKTKSYNDNIGIEYFVDEIFENTSKNIESEISKEEIADKKIIDDYIDQNKYNELTEFLFYKNENYCDKILTNIFNKAIEDNNLKVSKFLIENEFIELNYKNLSDYIDVICRNQEDTLNLIKNLLNKVKGNEEKHNVVKNYVFYKVAENDRVDIFNKLFEDNIVSFDNKNLMAFADIIFNRNINQQLLDNFIKNLEINKDNYEDLINTVFNKAYEENNPDIVDKLLKNEKLKEFINLNNNNSNNKKLINDAIENNNSEMIKVLAKNEVRLEYAKNGKDVKISSLESFNKIKENLSNIAQEYDINVEKIKNIKTFKKMSGMSKSICISEEDFIAMNEALDLIGEKEKAKDLIYTI